MNPKTSIVGIFLFTFLLSISHVSLAAEPKPEVPGPAGQRAFSELAALYKDGKQPDVADALGQLESSDSAIRSAAGTYLLALFQQSYADEKNGRAEWHASEFWGGGSQSAAREFRKRLAQTFGEKASGDGALDAMVWVLKQENLAEIQSAVVKVLPRINSDQADGVIGKLLVPPHPNGDVLLMAVQEAGRRKLVSLASVVGDLRHHHRTAIRDAARMTAKALGLEDNPSFKPTDAFGPWLVGQTRQFREMVMSPIPPEAQWCAFTYTNTAYRVGGEAIVKRFSGWLLAENGEEVKVLDWFGTEHTLPRKELTFAHRSLAEEAMHIGKLQTQKSEDDDREGRGTLSRRGMLTGQFEPRFVNVPAALVGAWYWEHGEKEACAALWLPLLDQTKDDRWFTWAVRDLLGDTYHQAMLEAFSRERDYGRVLAYATHLSKPVFDGYVYQARAKELATQLPRRQDDFKTLKLPTPGEWKQMQSKLTRTEQIQFLAARLRLLNCIQWGQPGGVNYDDVQYSVPNLHRSREDREQFVVVNPYVELRRLNLTVGELPALIPLLADDDFIPTFSYWRDFHPDRTLHRVNWLVADIVNDVAKRDLAGMHSWQHLSPAEREQAIARVTAWCRTNASKSREELLLDGMREAKDWNDFARVSREALRDKVPNALGTLLAREKDFSAEKEQIAEMVFYGDLPAASVQAHEWLKSTNNEVRFWATLILLKNDPDGRKDHLADLKVILEADDGTELYPRAIETLLALKDDRATSLACDILKRPKFFTDWNAGVISRQLFLAQPKEVLKLLVNALDNREDAGTSHANWEGKEVERKQIRGDDVAYFIQDWRTDGWEYPKSAPENTRAKARDELKKWLQNQCDLIYAGKSPSIKTNLEKPYFSRWQVDAP